MPARRWARCPKPPHSTFRAGCEWVNGTHSRTTVEKFFGVGQEQSHKQAYVLDTDHPEVFAAEDNGITPPEMMLVGLVGCLTAGIASVAQNRGIQLHTVRAHVEGHVDLQGILGIDPDVRNGFDAITVTYDIDADATPDEVRALVAQSQKRSAVFDVITNPTSVAVQVA